jgi:hypothetical protein
MEFIVYGRSSSRPLYIHAPVPPETL